MKRYLSLFQKFTQNNLAREMEYRENFIFWVLVQVFYVGLHLLTINIYFSFADTIAGWTKIEVYFLVGVFRIMEGTFKMLIHPNIVRIPDF
ncbi:MAG: ABC-2 family transporter protein, partial [Candidatus Amesbacteria bacterium]|nr:ABC-2 family transporter protein [Candidatus Amesbacteria bacterium]